MRAAAIDISPESSAGGFILPDDRVDVVLTRRDKAAEKQTGVEKFTSDTIIRNLRVLAIDQAVDDATKNDSSKANVIGKTATLELDPAQAEILTAAQASGTLSLSLRSAADNDDYRLSNRQAVRIIRAGHSEILNTPF